VDRYAGRISGPLRDRIDLWVHMPRVKPDEYMAAVVPEGSRAVRARIAEARALQLGRQGCLNSTLSGRALRAQCRMTPASQAHAVRVADLEGWSARGTERLLRVARTAADLTREPAVASEHLDEAARFRAPGSSHVGWTAVG
jgi:magnesium chelatase family protein